HTQLDLEMSFISDEEDILRLLEELYYQLAQTVTPHFKVQAHPFPRLTYEESVRRVGAEKPDLRCARELVDLTDALRDSEFAIFRQTVAAGGVVRAICVPGGAAPSTSLRTGFSRKQTDDLTTFVQQYGAKGLVSLALTGDGPIDAVSQGAIRSPGAQSFTVEQAREVGRLAGAGPRRNVLGAHT